LALRCATENSCRPFVVPTRVIIAIVLILLLTTSAQAGTWYLMAADAADAKVVSNPSVADRLLKGAVLGPLELISQGEFS